MRPVIPSIIIAVIKLRMMRWRKHVARLRQMRTAHRLTVLVEKLQEIVTLGEKKA
jgi:hypothetical protein